MAATWGNNVWGANSWASETGTVSLTGLSSTATVGTTLSFTSDVNLTLTGISATSTVGTITQSLSPTLTLTGQWS